MKKALALILVVLTLAAALCSCGGTADVGGGDASAPAQSKTDGKTEGGDAVSTDLPGTFEIAATEPHDIIFTPDRRSEGYGLGFALNEKGNKKYAIVVACGSEATEVPLAEVFSTLYNDGFNGILMQNYRAVYTKNEPATAEVKLADGSTALRFSGTQPADDHGTALDRSVYGYGFFYDGVPFIVAYIVLDEDAADEAKRAEMQGYVDKMVNTVRSGPQ